MRHRIFSHLAVAARAVGAFNDNEVARQELGRLDEVSAKLPVPGRHTVHLVSILERTLQHTHTAAVHTCCVGRIDGSDVRSGGQGDSMAGSEGAGGSQGQGEAERRLADREAHDPI